MYHPVTLQSPFSQRGMTMVVVLIFLFLLTLLGISSMSSSSLQERMASNAQAQTSTFQTAESAIADVIATNTVFDTVIISAASVTNSATIGHNPVSTIPSSTGTSLPTQTSLGCFINSDFSIDATADNTGSNAHAHNTQGVTITSPGAGC